MRSIDDSAENHSGSKQQLSWLEQEVKHTIDEYRQRRRRDKRKSFTLRLGTVGLSAAITVLLGISTFAVMLRRGPRLAGLPGFLRLWLVGGMWGEIGLR